MLRKREDATDVAVGFVVELIDTVMLRYGVNFETAKVLFQKSGYWDLFNNIDVMCVGAHDDPEIVYKKVEAYL